VSKIVEALTAEQIEQVRSMFREYYAELTQENRPPFFEAELAVLPGPYAPPNGRCFWRR